MSSIASIGKVPGSLVADGVGLMLLHKIKGVAEQQGQQMVQLMQQSVQPHLGRNVDIKI